MLTDVHATPLETSPAPRFLAPDEELQLIRAFQRGDARAGNRLVQTNLGVVHAIAREYRLWGSAFEDLVQQGSMGLLRALQRFDAARAQSLRTYACYWIRAEMRDYVVRNYRIVRLGSTRTERKALRSFRVHTIETPAELAKRSGMPLARCEQLWPLLTRGDTHVDDTGGNSYGVLDRLAPDRHDPEVHALCAERTQQLRTQVDAALAGLSARERRIVEARMMSDEPRTLDQLGNELGLSRERVRQLEAGAKEKVKRHLDEALAA